MANNDKINIATALLDDFTAIKVKELIELRPWMKTKRFILLTKQREIEEYIDICIQKGKCVYDLETNSLNTRLDENGESHAKIVGICLSHDPDEGVYIPVAHTDADEYNVSINFMIRETKRLAASCVLIFHNFKYDGQILRSYGVVIDREDQYEDTYLMAAIQDASRKEKGLKYLSGALLDRPQLEIDDLGIQGTKKNTVAFYLVPPQKAVYYGGGDGMNTMALYLYLKEKLDEMDPNGKGGPWAIYNVEKRCLFVTMEMERNLVKIDKDYLIETNADVEQRMSKLINDIYKIAGHEFDINSTQQLGVVLFEELKIPYPTKALKTKTGHYQTNSEILEMVSTKNPIINLILTYRGYVKIKSTYLFNWLNNADENDEVKFQLNQIQADTGRFSGSGGKGLHIDGYCGVNCQNIPTYDKKNPHAVNLRRAMVAHHGFKMVSIDYAGEELRIATNFSKEPKWIQEFLHGTGDLHTITGKIITGKSEITKKERSLGKCVAKGTLIACEHGWIPIEELKEGDKVVTHNGTLKRVSKVHYMGIKPALTIESTTGYKITCGYNHQFLTSEDEWIRAEDLEINQELRSISCDKINPEKNYRVNFNFWNKGNNNIVSEELPYIELSPLWARLLGYLLGDGSINEHSAIIVCSPKYSEVKDDIVRICELLGLPVSTKLVHRKGAKNPIWNINIGSTIFSRFCKHIGFRGRKGKIFRIPKSIFKSPKNVSKEFLKGLFETDGTVGDLVSMCTKDKCFAQDIVLLLSSFGIKAYIYAKPSKKYKRDYYQIQMGRVAANKFSEEIGFISSIKKDRLSSYVSRPTRNFSRKNQFWLTNVKNIVKEENLELWDLTVEDDHTYVAQGFVTHNTVNFLTMYGGGAGGFAAQAKIPFETAKKMIINFFKEYSGLNSWIKREWKISRKRGYSKTAFGRRRPLQEFYNSQDKGIQSKGDRCAINSAIQGCLQGHERILTDIGYIPIMELYRMPNELLQKIKVWTGTSWKTFDVMDRGEAQYAELELSNGMILNCDVRHEVLVVGKNGYEFRHFNDLDEETEVCVSIPSIKQFGSYPDDFIYESKAHNGKSFSIKTKEQWDFIGYLMGYVIEDGGIRFGTKESLTLYIGAEKIKKYLHKIEGSIENLGLCLSKMRRTKSAKGESYQVQINSKGLVDLFVKLGYIPSNSHEKRVPEIIYRVPVDMRKAFIQGYFDTDGCKKRRNRYGFHTPNIDLLRDIQLIGWTVGLSSIVRDVKNGNYKLEWQDLKKVEDFLEIPSTKWKRRSVINKMLLPEFLREEIHSKLFKRYDRKNVNDCSYFCKLNTGKSVSLPGMLSMMDKYKCDLPNEIYYHYKLKKRTVLHKKDHTYTLAVHSTLHRFDSSGIISKNTGADIIKIAMWRVYRWIYDNNLQDDVKILLPVHDEILYEVREEKMDMIIPELCRLMKIRDVTDKLNWEVPLEVDAEYGDSFHVDHDYWKEMEEKMKESPSQAPSLENSVEKPEVPETPETPVAPEVPEPVEELYKPEAPDTGIERPEKPERPEIVSAPVIVGTSSSGSMSYYHNLTITSGPETSGLVQNVLGKTEEKSGQNLFKDAHMENNIDNEGYFNYTIDINLMSAHKLKFILETIRLGDNLFIGPKNKICLMNSEGDVFYKSKEEISIDSFIILCMVLDV